MITVWLQTTNVNAEIAETPIEIILGGARGPKGEALTNIDGGNATSVYNAATLIDAGGA